jgi:hypothetical protein
MTASAAAAGRLGLHAEPGEVQHGEPDAGAPEQTDDQGEIDVLAMPLRIDVHSVTILSSILAVQIAWLGVLGYGLYSLMR